DDRATWIPGFKRDQHLVAHVRQHPHAAPVPRERDRHTRPDWLARRLPLKRRDGYRHAPLPLRILVILDGAGIHAEIAPARAGRRAVEVRSWLHHRGVSLPTGAGGACPCAQRAPGGIKNERQAPFGSPLDTWKPLFGRLAGGQIAEVAGEQRRPKPREAL